MPIHIPGAVPKSSSDPPRAQWPLRGNAMTGARVSWVPFFFNNPASETRRLIPYGYDAHRVDGFNASSRAKKALDKKSTSRHSLVHDLLD
jgi:hypothetical protein